LRRCSQTIGGKYAPLPESNTIGRKYAPLPESISLIGNNNNFVEI